jgi:hypothetical protein
MSKVHILGKSYTPQPPSGGSGFTSAEEWISAAHTSPPAAAMRVAAAALALCCPGVSRETLSGHSYDVLAFGGAVYGVLRKAGATAEEIAEAATPCYAILRDLVSPTEQEVVEKANFSKGGDASTASPSSSP